MSIDFEVFFGCPMCGQKVNTTFQKIQNHELLKCGSCNNQFTIHDVYDYYYANDPLAKGSIDLLTTFSGDYKINPTGDDSHKSIEKFLQDSKFDVLLKEAFKHVFLYGDAYILLKKNNEKIIGLELLHPKDVSVDIGKHIQRGQAFTGEREIKGFNVKKDKQTINFSTKDIIHLKGHDLFFYDTYGDARMRISLPQLYNLRFLRTTNHTSLITMLERSVIAGFGVPIMMIQKRLNETDAARILVSLFTNDIRVEHSHARGKLQKMVKDIAHSMNLETVPEIQLLTPSVSKILAYCGYDMAKDLKELEKLVDTKIISPAEFENIKRQWTEH